MKNSELCMLTKFRHLKSLANSRRPFNFECWPFAATRHWLIGHRPLVSVEKTVLNRIVCNLQNYWTLGGLGKSTRKMGIKEAFSFSYSFACLTSRTELSKPGIIETASPEKLMTPTHSWQVIRLVLQVKPLTQKSRCPMKFYDTNPLQAPQWTVKCKFQCIRLCKDPTLYPGEFRIGFQCQRRERPAFPKKHSRPRNVSGDRIRMVMNAWRQKNALSSIWVSFESDSNVKAEREQDPSKQAFPRNSTDARWDGTSNRIRKSPTTMKSIRKDQQCKKG
jgi:hypothetical protein